MTRLLRPSPLVLSGTGWLEEEGTAKAGAAPVVFPSGHGGFLGGEYGQPGKPEAFAATLHDVLDA